MGAGGQGDLVLVWLPQRLANQPCSVLLRAKT